MRCHLSAEAEHCCLEGAVGACGGLVEDGGQYTVLEPVGPAAHAHNLAHFVSIAQEFAGREIEISVDARSCSDGRLTR